MAKSAFRRKTEDGRHAYNFVCEGCGARYIEFKTQFNRLALMCVVRPVFKRGVQ